MPITRVLLTLLFGLSVANAKISIPNPIGDYPGKFQHTPNKWVALNKNMTFANLAWGPPNYKFNDDRYGHKVVFVDPYNEFEEDEYKRFKEMADGKHIFMCYFSAGTFEDFRDVTKQWFEEKTERKELFMQAMDDWPDEIWLDISKYDLMKQYIRFQIDLLADFGCHGIEPDNIDCWDNEDCVGDEAGEKKWYNHQKRIVKYMANYAHSKGMAIAHKNNTAMIKEIVDLYDCAIVESAHQYGEVEPYSPFVEAGKPVFLTEYKYSGSGALDKFCEASETLGMFLKYQKGSKWENCFSDGEFKNSYSYKQSEDTEQNALRSGGVLEFENETAFMDGNEEGSVSSKIFEEYLKSQEFLRKRQGERRLRGVRRFSSHDKPYLEEDSGAADADAAAPNSADASSETLPSQEFSPHPHSTHEFAKKPVKKRAAPETSAPMPEVTMVPFPDNSSSNTAMVAGVAAGAAGAFLFTAVGIAAYKSYARGDVSEVEADYELQDRAQTSSYDFN